MPAAPGTSRAQSMGAESQLVVDWNDVNPNGAPVNKYQVQEFRGGELQRTLPEVQASEQTITVPNFEADYSYAVRAYNKAGWSAYGAQSAPRRAVGEPAAPTGVALAESRTGAEGHHVVITFNELTAQQRNGARASEVSYRANFSDGRQMGIRSGQEVGGFPNGTAVTATVTAIVNSDGSNYASQPGGSNQVNPFGRPGQPAASAQGGAREQKFVDVSWNAPDPAANDVKQIQIRINGGGGWENVRNNGNRRITTNGYDEQVTIEVRSLNSRDTAGNIATARARSGQVPPPPPPAPTEWDITAGGPGLDSRSCMDPAGGTNFDPATRDCRGEHWMYNNQTMKSNCYISRSSGPWYRQQSGPNTDANNDGLFLKGTHTTRGNNPPAGMPRC